MKIKPNGIYRILADSLLLESPQVSRTRLSILLDLNNVVDWMFSTHPSASKSSSPFNNPLVAVPKAPTTNGIIVILMFHSLFVFSIPLLGKSTYPPFYFLSVLFYVQPGQQSPQFYEFSFFVDYYKVWSSGRV